MNRFVAALLACAAVAAGAIPFVGSSAHVAEPPPIQLIAPTATPAAERARPVAKRKREPRATPTPTARPATPVPADDDDDDD